MLESNWFYVARQQRSPMECTVKESVWLWFRGLDKVSRERVSVFSVVSGSEALLDVALPFDLHPET